MNRSLIVLLVFATVVLYSCEAVGPPPPRLCRPDQVYKDCGTACPPTCKDRNPKICTKQCVVGCQCKPGLMTQPDRSCIDPKYCPKSR